VVKDRIGIIHHFNEMKISDMNLSSYGTCLAVLADYCTNSFLVLPHSCSVRTSSYLKYFKAVISFVRFCRTINVCKTERSLDLFVS